MASDSNPFDIEMTMLLPNKCAAANGRPAELLGGPGDLLATVAADRAFPATVAELASLGGKNTFR